MLSMQLQTGKKDLNVLLTWHDKRVEPLNVLVKYRQNIGKQFRCATIFLLKTRIVF